MRPVLPAVFLGAPIAHRALHDRAAGRPENSRAAVRAAVAAGYGIEIDIQPSADGVPMVFHDYDLVRLTGRKGKVNALTAAQLAATGLRDADDGVPTLAEVLDIVAGRVPLLIEVKDQDGALGPAVGPLETAVAEVLAGYDGPVALMSFNPHSVAALAAAAPDLPRGLTTCNFSAVEWARHGVSTAARSHLRKIADFDRVGACFISHQHTDLGRRRVAELRGQGAAILCWTIRTTEAEAAARRVAQNITFEGYGATLPA